MNKFIAVYAGSYNDFNFFFRMRRGLEKNNYRLIFLSNKLSVLLKIWKYNQNYFVIKKTKLLPDIPDLSSCSDLKQGYTTYNKAAILYSSVYNAFRTLSSKYQLEYIFIWNGLSIQTMAASAYAKDAGLKTRYFELSNLPGKTFVNPEGVNAKSGLYRDITLLKTYNTCTENEFTSWKGRYLLWKLADHKLPQERQLKTIQNYLFPVDLLGFRMFGLPVNGETRIKEKIKQYFSKPIDIPIDEYDIEKNRYIFLPLQVSSDTQLTFNSGVDNISAIKTGYKKALKINADLVIKLHPAERNPLFLNRLLELKKKIKFYMVNYNSWELIHNTELVLTINSTVGLEAMLFGRKADFLGRSFYPELKGKLLKNYIMSYLVEGDYFSSEEFSNKSVEKILAIK
jgi:capsular polysaccharide export protein